jgi:xanthine dehydrogenase accessory factor
VYWNGSPQADTGVPGGIAGIGKERVIYSPESGIVKPEKTIGEFVKSGDIIACVGSSPVHTQIDGVLRGLIHEGNRVNLGMKIADVDPRGVIDHCWTISEKALAIGGGVLEAILSWINTENNRID